MFKTAKLLENDNPIGEDLKDVSYHLNQIVDEISRICDFLPRRDKDEIQKLVKVTSIMRQKLNMATEDILES